MSKFFAHDANFVRQIIHQMLHVMQSSVRVNNLDSNLIAITVQLVSFILDFSFRSVTSGLRCRSLLACALDHAAAFAV